MLKISEKNQLNLPDDTVTSTLVVYGAKGMGKSHFGRALAEELFRAGNRFCFLDPVGANWGLRFGKTKEQVGIEVLILGGAHGDIPIEPTGGAVVADLVADESISTVVDVSRHPNGKMWSKGEKVRFVADFATRLYERQGERRDPLMLIIDEAGRYVPQVMRHGDVDIAKCVGAIEELVELGRNVGVGVTLITQRSARMNKSVSELADCMIAFRTIGPNSVEAILDWLGEHIPKDRWKALLGELRALPRGSALVVSPGWLEFEGVVKIRATTTYDSSETPSAGKRKQQPGQAKKPDLDKYLARMAATVERVKGNDPRALKQRIADLEKELKASELVGKFSSQVVFDDDKFDLARGTMIGQFSELRDMSVTIARVLSDVDRTLLAYRDDIKQSIKLPPGATLPSRDTVRSEPSPSQQLPAPPKTVGSSLGKCAATLLSVLASHYPKQISRGQLAVLSGYSSSSSTMGNALSELRSHGYLGGGGQLLVATEIGAKVGPRMELPTGAALIDYWRKNLGKCAAELLDILVEAYPRQLSKKEIEKRSKSGYSAASSTMGNALSELRKASLIQGKYGAVGASNWLMEG